MIYCAPARIQFPAFTCILSLVLPNELIYEPFFLPSPPASGGDGSGVRGNPRRVGHPARSCIRGPAYRRWHRVAKAGPSTGHPPHPQPFSPGEDRGRREPEGFNFNGCGSTLPGLDLWIGSVDWICRVLPDCMRLHSLLGGGTNNTGTASFRGGAIPCWRRHETSGVHRRSTKFIPLCNSTANSASAY